MAWPTATVTRGKPALRTLIYSILAGLKHREREVIELSFRHDLYDNDLAIALGVSWSRAHALTSRARGRLEEALSTLHIALTRREACPVLGELLADWDGQLTEDKRDLVSWHIGECQTCAHHGWGALRPAAFSRLLPLAPLPPELRQQVFTPRSGGGVAAGDQAAELGQHPGQSWSGDRHYGCHRVDRGGYECHAARLRWLPRRTRRWPSQLTPAPHVPRWPRQASGPL